ncbi:hypothetical protein G6F40_015751 [Rhizopus arrhizus]|nr:hypothetical protein G6F40_015751 [Rhizopus arrhizus]
MATRIVGMLNSVSPTRISALSIQPPKSPAANPTNRPIASDSTTVARPITSDMREPYRMADHTSRPCVSVPSRYCGSAPSTQKGGSSAFSKSSCARS